LLRPVISHYRTATWGYKINDNRQVSATGAVDASTIAASVSSQAQNVDHALLQGALNDSEAAGDKRSNADSAGSQMSRRRINAIQTSGQLRSNDRNISKIEFKHV